jgi:hypothetical protein
MKSASVEIDADCFGVHESKLKPGTSVDATVLSSEYFDGVRLRFGDVMLVDLTPEQAIEIGSELVMLGGYHRIFNARFGVSDLDIESFKVKARAE